MQSSTIVRLLLAAGSAMTLAPTPALAQDDRPNYDGFYVAGSAGAAVQNNDRKDRVIFDTNRDGRYGDTVVRGGIDAFGPAVPPIANSAPGGFCNGFARTSDLSGGCVGDKNDQEYSLKIGYDQQYGSHWVAGVLLEGSMTDAEDSTTAFSTTPAFYSFRRSIDYAISARGRFGYTPDGNGLFYVTGGPAYGKLNHDFRSSNNANFGAHVSSDPISPDPQRGGDSVWGYQFGGGAEITLGHGLGVGLEYLYSKFNDDDYFVAIPPGTPNTTPFGPNGTNFRPSDDDFDYHSLRATLIYRF